MTSSPEAREVVELVTTAMDNVKNNRSMEGVGESLYDLFVRELASMPTAFWENIGQEDFGDIQSAFEALAETIRDTDVWGVAGINAFESHIGSMKKEVVNRSPSSWRRWITDVRKSLDDIYAEERMTFFDARVACSNSADGLTSQIDRLTRGGYEASGGGGVRFNNTGRTKNDESPRLCAILERKTNENR